MTNQQPDRDPLQRPGTAAARQPLPRFTNTEDSVLDEDKTDDEWVGSAIAQQVAGGKRSASRGTFIPDWVLHGCSNPADAIVFAQILYWFGNDKTGKSRARVRKHRYLWLAKTHQELAVETGFSARRVRAVLDRLEEAGLIQRHIYRFHNTPTTHIRLLKEAVGRLFRATRDSLPDTEELV
jgi:hypothetical protein